MKTRSTKVVRCAIYTRVSTDQGLEQDFNSLDAQYEASQAYIRSQAHAGWTLLRAKYDDGGFSGGHTDRPALQRLLATASATTHSRSNGDFPVRAEFPRMGGVV
jgi:DNA invertase Pin-like site-specific DNA recombinase